MISEEQILVKFEYYWFSHTDPVQRIIQYNVIKLFYHFKPPGDGEFRSRMRLRSQMRNLLIYAFTLETWQWEQQGNRKSTIAPNNHNIRTCLMSFFV